MTQSNGGSYKPTMVEPRPQPRSYTPHPKVDWDELLGKLFMTAVFVVGFLCLCFGVFAVWASIHFAVKYW